MRLLLDTHAFLWFVMGDPRIGPSARPAIDDPANEKFVSVVTPWEIATKVSIGKLTLVDPFHILVPREISRNGFRLLPIGLAHTTAVVSLPFHHRDPFDRMLIAQGMIESMLLIGADAVFDAYRVTRIW